MKLLRIALGVAALTMLFCYPLAAQTPKKNVAVRMGVHYVNNLSAGVAPFDFIRFNTFSDDRIATTDSFTLACKSRFIPKSGVNIGIEFRLVSRKRFDINANLDFFFQGDPSEAVSTSKTLAVRPGLSSNILLCDKLLLNLKVGYSAKEASFYNLYDGDTLHAVTVTGNKLEGAGHAKVSQDFKPSHIALQSSTKTFAFQTELRYFIDDHVYINFGGAIFRYLSHDRTIYFSGYLDDGRVKWNDHNLPQAYTDIKSDSKAFFMPKDNDGLSVSYNVHVGLGVSLFKEARQHLSFRQ